MSQSPKANKKKRIFTILRILVGVVAIGLIAWQMRDDWAEFGRAWAQANPLILISAPIIFLMANLLIAFRWYTLLMAQKIKIPFFATIKIHLLGLFYNNILLSAVGGDFLRAWYVTTHTHKKLEAAFSVLVDRVIGLGTLFMMAFFYYWLFPLDNPEKKLQFNLSANFTNNLTRYSWVILAIIALGVLILWLLWRSPKYHKILQKIYDPVASRLHRVVDAVRLYWAKPVVLSSAVILTVIAQSISIYGLYIVGKSMGMPIPAKYYFVFLPLSWVIGALPISPGGVGILEGTLVLLFTRVPGVSSAQASVLAVCWRLMLLLGSLPGIVIHISGKHLPEEKPQFSVDSDLTMD